MQPFDTTASRFAASGALKRLALAGVAVCAALAAQRLVSSGLGWDAVALFGIALVLYLAAFPRASEPFALGRMGGTRSRWLAAAGLIAALAAVGLTVAALPHFVTDKPTEGGWTLHLSAVAAVLAAGLVLDAALRPAPRLEPRRWWPALLLLLITAAAAVLRLRHLDSMPFGVWYDEAENALAALDILRSPDYRPFYLGSTFHTAHHNYMVAAAFAWLGETIQSARLVSALMGILMVPAAWLVGSEIFWTTPSHRREGSATGAVMGLIFALIIAASSWALNFSRIAVNYIATPLFVLLATGFLLRGLRTQSMRAYLWSGLSLGMGLNFYSSFRLFLPVLPLFVLAAMVARRDLWGRSWRGLLLLSLAALVVAAPLITFAVNNREVFLSRSRDTFLLKDRPPEEYASALLQNARTHYLMFNARGDPNGRHNLPGRPMLDPILGALFVIGFGVCLWRWRRPAYLLLPVWLTFTLLGGILTLDFEAPQSLRSNGAMPAAYLIALVPLAEMLRAWERSEGGRYARRVGPLLAAGLVLPVAGWHLHQYYVVQQNDFAVWNAFSTPETITARMLAQLDPKQSTAYVISYYHGHPTLHFLAPQWRERYLRLESTDPIPLVWPDTGDVWLFMDVDSYVLFQKLQAVYPTAEIVEHTPPFSTSVSMRQVHLTRAVIESVQGLNARYYANNRWNGEPVRTSRVPNIDADWGQSAPLPLPFSVEYEGVLRVTTYGPHSFRLLAPARAEMLIDEGRVLAGVGELTGTITLAQGNHTLRVRAVGSPGRIQLAWRTPDAEAMVLPQANLFVEPVTANGLLGNYYPNDSWQGPEALAVIEPQINIIYHIVPLNRPFTVDWTGKIAIPETGSYTFSLQAIDTARLEIDGKLVAVALANQMTSDGSTELEKGLHDIRIRYAALSSHSRVNLYWTPPGGAQSPVPSAVLFPPQQDYARIEVPSFAMLDVQPASASSGPSAESAGDAGLGPLIGSTAEAVLTGLVRPSGVAATSDGKLVVADPGAAEVHIFDANGNIEHSIAGGEDAFQDPFDVAVGPDGLIYVLDAGAATIPVFDSSGAFMRTIRPDEGLVGRSRGLYVDGAGQIWIANTPGQRVVVIDMDGALVREFGAWPGEEAQAVDVATAPDGRVYAAVLGINKLVEYDSAGRRLRSWDIPTANTIDSPHLALDASGTVYLTQPEENRIALIGQDGTRLGYLQLAQGEKMVKPVGIAIDSNGTLYVGNSEGGSVVRIDR